MTTLLYYGELPSCAFLQALWTCACTLLKNNLLDQLNLFFQMGKKKTDEKILLYVLVLIKLRKCNFTQLVEQERFHLRNFELYFIYVPGFTTFTIWFYGLPMSQVQKQNEKTNRKTKNRYSRCQEILNARPLITSKKQNQTSKTISAISQHV